MASGLIRRILYIDACLSLRLATLSVSERRRQTARLVAHWGDGQYVFGVLSFVYLFGWLDQAQALREAIMVIGMTVLMAVLVVTLIKFIVKRKRPQPPGEFVTFQYDAYSFPSGHSARLAALATITLIFYPLLGCFLSGVALLVGLARIVVGVHYLSDVLVGLALGILVAWSVAQILPLLPMPPV